MNRLNNEITSTELNKLKNLIQQARVSYEVAQQAENEVFDYLERIGISEPSDISCVAPNADNLYEAITCYLNYGEWSIKDIMEFIESIRNVVDKR